MYYIESILWDTLISDVADNDHDRLLFDNDLITVEASDVIHPEKDALLNVENVFNAPIVASSFENISSHHLHQILMHHDPEAGNWFHPNDKRRIIRSLQIIQRHGRTYSDLVREQQSQEGGNSYGGPLRFKDAIVFWTQVEKSGKCFLHSFLV